MNRTLTLQTFNAANATYGAPVTQTLEAWGITAEVSGNFASATPDELNLGFAGAGLAATTQFTYRSKVALNLDGKPFFQGYVGEDPRATFNGETNQSALKIYGPWWFFEKIVFMLTVELVTGWNGVNPILTPNRFTHFTLNQGYNTLTGGGVLYQPIALSSQDQIKAVLDFAIAAGANFTYNYAELLNVPVLPRDVLNITCADAIRRQMEDVDAVVWFDHTQTPPMFHCKRRKDLANQAVSLAAPNAVSGLGSTYKARGFQELHQRFDLTVPFVRIDYEQMDSLNGQSYLNVVSDIYPYPTPTDSFNALITSVPIRGFSATTTQKWIKTAAIDPTTTAFWLSRKPEMDPNVNPNAAVEYANLAIIPGSAQRQSQLPNMIIEGGYADWMGGNSAEDNILAQATYQRKTSAAIPGTKVQVHTLHARVRVTDLNYPAGATLSTLNTNSVGENPLSFVGLAQIIYTDLNLPQFEGEIPVFEAAFSGTFVLGINYNLNNGKPAHATMNALAQQIAFTSKPGGLFATIRVGPNKSITPAQLADRLRARRLAYITVVSLAGNNNNQANTVLTREEKQDNTSNAEPQVTEQNIYDQAQGQTYGGLVSLSGNGGQPFIALKVVNADNTPNTQFSNFILHLTASAKLADGSGGTPINGVAVGGAVDANNKVHTLEVYQLTTCEDDGSGNLANYTRLFVCSDRFKASGQ